MKAIAITPGEGNAELIDSNEPQITHPKQVKVKVLEVGICGTDREEAIGGRADAPHGSHKLVIGHEMFGRVVEVGSDVVLVHPGDYAVFTVRRGCGECVSCKNNRSDMCYTGDYTERGIKEAHGFETEYVVDDEQYLVKVPETIKSVGVLAEPMSVAEKAIDEAVKLQAARLPEVDDADWLQGKTTLVAGVGAIGMLAAIVLRLRGARVLGLDIVDEDTKRPQLLKRIGGEYIDGRKIQTINIDDQYGEVDLIFEATGVAELGFNLIDALGINGVYVMTGIPHGNRPVCITGPDLMRQLVLKNQVILGSVNASQRHFALGIEDLEKARNKWGDVVDELITTRLSYTQFSEALNQRDEDDIKTVIQWSDEATQ
ncbi:Threonine dehydrogenase [Catalinimonas alkaloidigena]|uniref:Threonine dehydrogenase n=1 Tax=Catalinimonas alkaloidigena TaxID=1075417 RepID=A0A1G9F5I2_9BACT|nr:glucose 1-dehydrogenase [Catalinimonas alkaloidigena]SDK83591.1 Threonine dehydrogenase [Catalinimonas alkaloidigena]